MDSGLAGFRPRPGMTSMKILCAVAIILASLSAPAAAQRGADEPVDLALVLAVDASGSVDQVRFELQKQGYVAAFRHPRVVGAITIGSDAIDCRHHDAMDRTGTAGDRGPMDAHF